MKTKLTSLKRSNGSALMLVMIMAAVAVLIMAAVMNRTSTVSKLNDRNNRFNVCNAVAAAAAEKVYDSMAYDFQTAGLGQVTNSLGIYRTNIPTAAENPYWGNFMFSDAQGHTNQVFVGYLTNYGGAMPSQYTNLATVTAPIYRIVVNASQVGYPDIVGTVQEDVLLSLVPITTYAIFYNGDLEFSQCATMSVYGRTHSNGQVAVGTSTSSPLTFNGVVSAGRTVDGPPKDGITFSPWNQGTTFNSGYTTNVPSVTVAMTMTNSHAIIDIPPPGELPGSQQGQLREYNQANVTIIVTNQQAVGSAPPTPQVTIFLQVSQNGLLPMADTASNTWGYIYTNISVTPTNPASAVYVFTNYSTFLGTNMMLGRSIPGYSNEPPTQFISSFLSITNKFTDKREYQTNFYVTQIDLGALAVAFSNAFFTGKFSGTLHPLVLYVADRRNVGTNKMAAVRLVNAAQLPYNNGVGFSVATPNPLYTKGNYNVTADGVHYAYTPGSTTNNNMCTTPAALMCDAITILSSQFLDAPSSNTVGTVTVSNTVNAAIITGNVPSTDSTVTGFSGGVHNLMRMQEIWTGDVLVLNTSIVVLWASQMATQQFRNPIGWTTGGSPVNPYYNPPTRQWGFDPNFYNPAKQPPGVPSALIPIRFNWTTPPPNTTNSNIGNW